tara:strand:+ start:2358 stop:2750 length:393 start_codon:yes stop_codon:yes gene_type:complete
MSVFAQNKICSYEAPLSISDAKAVVSGSWSIVSSVGHAMDPNYLLQYRLHKWKQQVAKEGNQEITEACCDWVIKSEKGQLRHYAVVKLYGQHFASFNNSAFLDSINKVLEEQNAIIVGIKTTIDLAITPR